MLRVAAITDPGHPGLRPDDANLRAAFAAEGCELTAVPWGEVVDRERADVALIRTPWDYFERPVEFLDWASGAVSVPLLNDVDVLRWNHDKRYLFDLGSSGAVALPRTRLIEPADRAISAAELVRELDAERVVLKPCISGGAWRTRVLSAGDAIEWTTEDQGAFLAQAYVPEIEVSGEWSVMVFGDEISHCIRKTPAAGDFRVQEEHGGRVHAEDVPPALAEAARRALGATADRLPGSRLAYARVDLVWDGAMAPLLMELELIEPELFFRSDPAAASRFARAVSERLS